MKIQRKILVLFLAVLFLVSSGCGQKEEQPKFTTGKNTYSGLAVQQDSTEVEIDEQKTAVTGLYVVMQIDTQSEMLTFQKVENGKMLERPYNGGTCFYNKYGDIMSLARLELGCVVSFRTSEDMMLTEVRVSDIAWEREGVDKYSFDAEKNIFSIGQSNYAFDGDTCFFSDDGAIMLSDIGTDDELRVWGIDKKILSITVITGHGEIEFLNTEAFRGGYVMLCGAKKYYYEITDFLTVEIPEGTYQLTAAGNGYGGSTEITVERNQQLDVDLDTLKGEGPKYCTLSFTVTVPDTKVLLDGQAVDINEPISVSYGTHALQAAATGYSAWSRQLVVNSQTATIIIDVTTGDKTSEESSEAEVDTEVEGTLGTEGTNGTATTSGVDSSPYSGSSLSSGSQSSQQNGLTNSSSDSDSDAATNAYLDTLSGIVDTLTGE